MITPSRSCTWAWVVRRVPARALLAPESHGRAGRSAPVSGREPSLLGHGAASSGSHSSERMASAPSSHQLPEARMAKRPVVNDRAVPDQRRLRGSTTCAKTGAAIGGALACHRCGRCRQRQGDRRLGARHLWSSRGRLPKNPWVLHAASSASSGNQLRRRGLRQTRIPGDTRSRAPRPASCIEAGYQLYDETSLDRLRFIAPSGTVAPPCLHGFTASWSAFVSPDRAAVRSVRGCGGRGLGWPGGGRRRGGVVWGSWCGSRRRGR
jgi:hypothetical protein